MNIVSSDNEDKRNFSFEIIEESNAGALNYIRMRVDHFFNSSS